MGAQLHIIPYKKTPIHFLELHGVIDFRCKCWPVRFWYHQ